MTSFAKHCDECARKSGIVRIRSPDSGRVNAFNLGSPKNGHIAGSRVSLGARCLGATPDSRIGFRAIALFVAIILVNGGNGGGGSDCGGDSRSFIINNVGWSESNLQ